jgi:glyoxylase I family protein
MDLLSDVVDIGIVVSDADRSLAFYRDFLGMELVTDKNTALGHAWFLRCGRTTLELLQFDTPPQHTGPTDATQAFGYRFLMLRVRDLEGLVDSLTAAGYAVPLPVSKAGDLTFAMVADPDGNWIELVDGDPTTTWTDPPVR